MQALVESRVEFLDLWKLFSVIISVAEVRLDAWDKRGLKETDVCKQVDEHQFDRLWSLLLAVGGPQL